MYGLNVPAANRTEPDHYMLDPHAFLIAARGYDSGTA
jgi:hypothetical protein